MLTGFRTGADRARAALKLSYISDQKDFNHYNVDWMVKGEARLNHRTNVPVSEICFLLADLLKRENVVVIGTTYIGEDAEKDKSCWVKSNKSIMMF